MGQRKTKIKQQSLREAVCVRGGHQRKGRWRVEDTGPWGSLLSVLTQEWVCDTRESGNLAEEFLLPTFQTEL